MAGFSDIWKNLQKIKAGNPVNYEVFRNALLAHGYSVTGLARVFKATLVAPRKYAVAIEDDAAFSALLERFTPSDAGGRVGSALDGDSHKTNVSGSLLVARNEADSHPVVVVATGAAVACPRCVRKFALVVENLENFLHLTATLDLAAESTGIARGDFEVIFGSGNQVTNKLNIPFFSAFERVYCLFDVDVGGLRMFCTLKANLPAASDPVFVYPLDVEARLGSSKYPLGGDEREELSRYVGRSAATDFLIQMMRKTHKVLEQEAYLDPLCKMDVF